MFKHQYFSHSFQKTNCTLLKSIKKLKLIVLKDQRIKIYGNHISDLIRINLFLLRKEKKDERLLIFKNEKKYHKQSKLNAF